MKTVEYYCELLQQQYVIIVGSDITQLKRMLENRGSELPYTREEMEKIHGCFFTEPLKDDDIGFISYIWSREADPATLIHESYHALFESSIKKFRPIRKNEELWARMLEAFWRRVIEPLTSKKKRKPKFK